MNSTSTPGYMGYTPSWNSGTIPTSVGVKQRVPIEERAKGQQHRATAGHPTRTTVEEQAEALLLQKRAGNYATIYTTDTAAAGTLPSIKPYTKANPAPQSRCSVPDPKPFLGKSITRAAGEDRVAHGSTSDFFSQSLKEDLNRKQLDEETGNSTLNRLSEGRDLSKKGHGGAQGLSTLRQASYVEANSPKIPEMPKPTYKNPPTRQLNCLQAPAATDFVKFAGTMTQRSSYQSEYGTKGENPRERMPQHHTEFSAVSTTRDMFAGTTKSATTVTVPGYAGHVPTNEKNLNTLKGSDDAWKTHTKDSLLITNGNDLPGYGGFKAISIYNDRGREMKPDLSKTTSGTAATRVDLDETEKAMNTRDHAKSHAIKTFFSRGGGEDTALVADFFYSKYRPFEGVMKHGCSSEQKWISDTQLHRSMLSAAN